MKNKIVFPKVGFNSNAHNVLNFNFFKFHLLLIIFLVSTNLMLVAQDQVPQRELTGNQAEKVVPGAQTVLEGINTNIPAYVIFKEGKEIAYPDFFPWLNKRFGISADNAFEEQSAEQDNLGFVNYRFVQTFKGIPIDRAECRIQVKNNKVVSFSGDIFSISALSFTNKINEKNALEIALKQVGADSYMWETAYWENELKEKTGDPNATYFPKGELIWARVEVTNKLEFRLAYQFDINPADHHSSQRVLIDAASGNILNVFMLESNCSAATVNTIFNGNRSINTDKFTGSDWRLRDDCTSSKMRVRDWNSTSASWPPPSVDIENTTNTWTTFDERFGGSVLWATRQSYNYFNVVHGRNSYNNGGGNVDGYINAWFSCTPAATCSTQNNASMSFTGGRMKVGLGSSGTLANSYATLDIIAHEYTHAVTGSSSGLVYQGESGALNESFSDIFGDVIERRTTGTNDWIVGGDRSSGGIRSMSNPKAGNDPDTYQGTNWANTGAGQPDNGGVHTNSGVQNYWFFLLSQGGSGTNDNGDAFSVTGIGINKARLIAFRNLTVKLGANSNYAAARTGAIAAAVDLYGACSQEVRSVTDAWYAVGVGAAPFMDISTAVTSNYNGRDVSCAGSCDGSATVSVNGSASPFTYLWSSGSNLFFATKLCASTYTVTVTDNGGCTSTATVTLGATPAIGLSVVASSNYNGYDISCYGASDGQATANPSGGSGTFTYLWNTGASTKVINNLSAGNYSVTVTDANGCIKGGSVILVQPPLLTASAHAISNYNGYNVSCNGGSDGAATATPGGGVAPYTYQWNDASSQTTQIATGLKALDYTVTITDRNGCTATGSTSLTEPPVLTVSAAATSNYNGYNVSCNGGSDGEATATPGGGVAPYTYAWSDAGSQTTAVATGLMATTYWVTVTDNNGCTTTDSTTLTEPTPLFIEAGNNQTRYYGYPDSACADLAATGASGGVPPYTVEWSTTETTYGINVCPQFTTVYYVTITDLNNCTYTDSVKVCMIDVRCGNNMDKILICHLPQGDGGSPVTMCLGFNAVKQHLAIHGDQLAACGTDKSCEFEGGAKRDLSSNEGIHNYSGLMVNAFPNPFKDNITINFRMPYSSNISLRLYSLTGQEVANLYEGEAEAELLYSVIFNTSILPEGMYFYQLETSDAAIATEKIVLIR